MTKYLAGRPQGGGHVYSEVLVHGGVKKLSDQKYPHHVDREAKSECLMLLAFPFLSPQSIKPLFSPLTR